MKSYSILIRTIRFAGSLSVLAMVSSSAMAQGGYYISRTITYPDETVRTESIPLNVPANREDVAAIGMGKTQVANGLGFNAMMYNPALLSHTRFSARVPDLQVGIPTESIGALSFLSDNIDQFRTGLFLRQIKDGINQLNNAATFEDQLAALQLIQQGLQFPRELQEEVGGTIANPQSHGIAAIPSLMLQVDNWGFSIYGVSQTGFQLQSSQAVAALASVHIPSTLEELTPELVLDLLTAVEPLFDAQGNLREDVLPVVYALSYLDIVGTAGYAHQFTKDLSVGAAVKVINRRFSTKRIAVDYYDSILSEARKDFDHSVTGVTLDLGGLWSVPNTGLGIGVSLQNLIPMNSLESIASVPLYLSGIQDYDRDQFGNPIVTNGDTALVAAEQNVLVQVPFELDIPLIVNFGSVYRLTDKWDIAFDWVDIGEQDSRYEETVDRIRLGTEYRLTTGDEGVGVAFRGGMAHTRPTVGVGFDFFNVVTLDAAYAYDSFVGEPAYFAQLGVGW